MTKNALRRGHVVLLMLLMMSGLQAYTIWPGAYIHESMTAAAKRCFDRSSSAKPARCDTTLPEDGGGIELWWIARSTNVFARMFGVGERYPRLDEVVRWPDDPTRQVAVLALPKFGGTMASRCRKLAQKRGTIVNGIGDGLLCSSHFGRLQFFHAQADTTGRPAVETYDKIKRWATFLYSVAALRSNEQLSGRYCDEFAGSEPFDVAMTTHDGSDRCPPDYLRDWTVTDFFTFSCADPFIAACAASKDSARFTRTRIIATGALLHLIQDSYSQSHCIRGSCDADSLGRVARIECRPITMYTTYIGQSAKLHGRADRVPTLGDSCGDASPFDDPVTASAKMLWHISRKNPVDSMLVDFERVFGPRGQTVEPSGVGRCFGTPARSADAP